MSLEKRIIKLQPFYDKPSLDYDEGFRFGTGTAAQLAKEADELIADCEKVLTGIVDHHGSMRAFHLLEKIRKFKESTK